ncbi:AAA family ATPase [Candidatus Wolfebacteria bacterium]|nr:AAA family ATPase [Candidatus Wolfebacteria bacterium]
MFLKSLELNGFKSFASKTILEFPTGITAVVGPNGSGKSNIIDAIRWLLGERETKNLRSIKAEDLIFNGTPQKPRMSLGSAGLHFDNESGFFPVDFKEVSVIRQVDRGGISRYFLNKAEVRLKDIIDFFSRSRLGTKGLSIINQGNSDLFVKASPCERRIMIEEILGLREYQIKKTDAERKLKNTSFNLEKVRAMIGEVAPRLRMLKRQTNKWEKRTDIQKELENLENNYFFFKLKNIKDERLKINPILNSLDIKIKEKEKELKNLEIEVKKIESQPKEESREIKKIKIEQENLLNKRSEIQKDLGRIEAKLEIIIGSNEEKGRIFGNEELLMFIKETKGFLEKCLNYSDFENLNKKIKEFVKKIEDFLNPSEKNPQKSQELIDLKKIKEELELKFFSLEKELKNFAEQEEKFTIGLEKFNEKFQEAFESVETKRKELRNLDEEKNKVILEKEKLNFKFQDLENQLQQAGRRIDEFENFNLINENIEKDFSDMERKIFKLRGELAAMGEIDNSLIKEAREVEEHYNFLTDQSKDLDSAVIDLKSLIRELSEKIHSEFNGSLRLINEEFNKFFRLMFGGGHAKLRIKNYEFGIKGNKKDKNEEIDVEIGNQEIKIEEKEKDEERELKAGVEIDLSLPKRKNSNLEMLSGGEKSLVSIAAIFALISISPPPFLVLDEIDAALDENNSKRFSNLIKEFCQKTQFIIVTHNRSVMEAANVLYGITTAEDGTSKVLSLKLEA